MSIPAGARRAQPSQHRWRSRARNGLLIFLALCVVVTGSGYLYLRHQLGRINRVTIPDLAADAHGVMNVLLVGSDSRENVSGDLADATGKGEAGTSGQRSDTIMVLHVDASQTKAAILSIPRDLYVPLAGTGGKDKINASFAYGGPQALIQTIQQSLKIDINHYVEVDFTGFERIVDTVGGVKVYVDEPARDAMTGLDIPKPGCVQLDGFQALAFVRSRYYESFENGRWVSGTNSDLDRIQRQQAFIRRMMKKAVSAGLSNPLTLNHLISIGVDNLTVDQTMSTKDITTVARKFRSLDPDTVDMLTLPTTDAYAGSAAVQLLDTKKAQQFIDRINGVVVEPAGQPGEVSVKVLNGNGGEASASRAASALQVAGFKVVGTGDADSYAYSDTVVRYGTGQQARAELLRSYLGAGATLEPDATLGADLVLVLGTNYSGVRAPVTATTATAPAPSPAAAAPPTTKAPAPAC